MTTDTKRHFADDLDQGGHKASNNADADLNQYAELADKWNAIQEAYVEAYPELDVEDLYFESGGFEGILEKIAKVCKTSVKEIRTEIQKW